MSSHGRLSPKWFDSPRIVPGRSEEIKVRESNGLSHTQRVHLCAATLALFGIVLFFVDSSRAAASRVEQPVTTWDITLETAFKGRGKAFLSFPDLPRAMEVDLDGSTLSLKLESSLPPRQVSLRLADGQLTRGYLMQSGNELTGKLLPADKPAAADRGHWRARTDRKYDWKSPLANAPLEIKTGPATEMSYRRTMPTVRLEAHEGDHKH